MTFIIILAVVVGILVGMTLLPPDYIYMTEYVIDFGLCLLLLLVGIDIGKQKNILKEIKALGMSIIVIPVLIGIGSITGALVVGLFLKLPINESTALGAGFGWYTLSAVMLVDYSAEISALAFLSNVIREVLAIMMIPIVAKWIGHMEAVAPAGATAMDTTLPIITRYTSSKYGIVAFISGAILSTSVPILVSLFISLPL